MQKNVAVGTVVSVSRQWWLKVNTKPIRRHALDGAMFPSVIKVCYVVDGVAYTKRKWIAAGAPCPTAGSRIRVLLCGDNPRKAKIML